MSIVKVMKFGGTSVGSPERMKALIPLITDNESKIVVLSAMSGTTNSLIEITDLLSGGKIKEASEKIEELKTRYHKVVDELYEDKIYEKTGHELIDSHFGYITGFVTKQLTRTQGKAIVGEGELISSALVHNLLLE